MGSRRLHLAPLLAGFALLVISLRVLQFFPSEAKFGGLPQYRSLTHISTGEFRLWLVMFLLVLPACIAMAFGVERKLGPFLEVQARRFDDMSQDGWRALGLGYFACLLVAAQLGNTLLLLGYQITDDESGVAFGGKLWAAGKLMAEPLLPAGAWNDLYMYRYDGMVSSMDWPGVIGYSALATFSGLGNTL